MLEPVDEFFDVGDFAESATFVDGSNNSSTILVIFQAPGETLVLGGEEFQTTEPTALCKSADVAAANNDCKLTVRSVQYKVRTVQPDGTGITRLILLKD